MTAPKKTAAVDPLAERDRLLETLGRIAERGADHSEERRKLQADLDAAEAALATARVADVLGDGSADDVQRCLNLRETAQDSMKGLGGEGKAIEVALKQTDKALINLHIRHRAAFEDEASQASKAADDALAQLGPALRCAAEKWGEAQAHWSRLISWVDHVGAPRLEPAEQLNRVPDFPVKLAIGAVQPRPYQRRIEGDTTELVPDRIAVFRDKVKDVERKAILGSAIWRDFLALPQFEFVRYEEPAKAKA